jgi:HAD superfamily hydrolase (TIGR01509 family)
VSAVRAVLFDLDGVLIDSFGAWVEAVNAVALRFGRGPYSVDHVRRIWGQGTQADVENLYPGRTVAEVQRAYDEAFPAHVAAIAVNPNAAPVLRRLRERGLSTAIVTNTQASLAESIVRAKGLRDLVHALSAVRSGVREKPAPDLLLTALEALRVPPSAARMVGDTRYDAEAAAAAGVAFVRYDFSRGEDLTEALAPLLGDPPGPAARG